MNVAVKAENVVMAKGEPCARSKAIAMLAELLPGRGVCPDPPFPAFIGDSAITAALTPEHGAERAEDISFHLSDWVDDAAFLLAVHLFPERFTSEEIREGILGFLIHVPNHVAAAAHLGGWPLKDVFGVGLAIDE